MGASSSGLKGCTALEVATTVKAIGAAYASYEESILSNGIDGDVLCGLAIEQLPMLFATIGVMNTIHQTKLTALYRQHRPSTLQRTLSQALRLDGALSITKATKPFDCFLSHDWGIDCEGRNNHTRVKEINSYLKSKGVITWFDEEQMDGNILKAMAKGIEGSVVALIFITQRYQHKVNGENSNDNCQLEFGMAKCTQTPVKMIPIIMESAMKHLSNWSGQLKMVLGNQLYVDLSSDNEEFQENCEVLVERIESKLIEYMPSPQKSDKGSSSLLDTNDIMTGIEKSNLIVETNDIPCIQEWLHAVELEDLELQDEKLQNVMEKLDSKPFTPDELTVFPYHILVESMTKTQVKESAIYLCGYLVEHKEAIDGLMKIPGFLDQLLDLLREEWTQDAALVVLCNLSIDEDVFSQLLGTKLISVIMEWQQPIPLKAIDLLANLATTPDGRSHLSQYICNIAQWSFQSCESNLRLLCNLSIDSNLTTMLIENGILIQAFDCIDTEGIKVLQYICRHSCGCTAIATNEQWMDGLYQLDLVPSNLQIQGRLTEENSMCFLPKANEWMDLWCRGLEVSLCTESALICLCNVSIDSNWYCTFESIPHHILKTLHNPTPYLGITIKILANLVGVIPTYTIQLDQMQDYFNSLLQDNLDDETKIVLNDLINSLNSSK